MINPFSLASPRLTHARVGWLLLSLCCLLFMWSATPAHAWAPSAQIQWEQTRYIGYFPGCLIYSPTRPVLAAVEGFGAIALLHTDGTVVSTIYTGLNGITSLAFSPDGNTLASASSQNSIMLWDVNPGNADYGACLQTLIGGHEVVTVAFSPDGNTLASGSLDNTLMLWDVNSKDANYGQPLYTFSGLTCGVNSLAFSPDGKTLATGLQNTNCMLWDVHQGDVNYGQPLHTLSGDNLAVSCVAFSPDGLTLASASNDMNIKLWSVSSGTCLKTLVNNCGLQSLTFSPDGSTLASGDIESHVKLWNVSSGNCTNVLFGHTVGVNSVAYTPDGNTLLSGSVDSTIRVWDMNQSSGTYLTCVKVLTGYPEYTFWTLVPCVAVSPDGQTVATGCTDGTITLWRVSDGTWLLSLPGHTQSVQSVAFSPDSHTLASGSADQTVKLWDVNSSDVNYGGCLHTLTGHAAAVNSVAFSADGLMLASGSADNTIKLWQVSSGSFLITLSGHTNWVNSVAYSTDGKTLASGSADKTIRLWDVHPGDVNYGQSVKTLTGDTDVVNTVAFSPDGNTLASGSNDNTIRLWDVNSTDLHYGQTVKTLADNGALSVAFSPDGNTLAAGNGSWHNIMLWDVNSSDVNYGQSLLTLYADSLLEIVDEIESVAFTPDGQSLVEGSQDGVALWNLMLTQPSPRGVVITSATAEVNPILPTTVQVPITLTAQGDENALGGTITFDPTVLGNPQLTLGTDDPTASLMANFSQAGLGLIEFAVALPAAQTFAAGTRQVAVLTFTLMNTAYSGLTPVDFANLPVTCEVIDPNADYLDATWQNGSVYVNHPPVAVNDSYSLNENTTLTTSAPGVLLNDTDADKDPLTAVLLTGPSNGTLILNTNGSFTYTPAHNYVETDSFTYQAYDGMAYSNIATVTLTVNPIGYEGDVAKRPDGDGKLDIADWVQEGRYVAGLDIAAPGSEFMRADCAPLATKGDGHLTVADWVQVGRFVLGLDPLTSIGGPDHDPPLAGGTRAMSASRLLTGKTARALGIDAATLTRGKAGAVCVSLNALGNESALGFSVHFDAKHLKFVSAKVVGATAAATLLVNANAAAQGNLGVALMLPLPTTCKAGKGAVVEFTFLPLAAGATPLTFSDQVVSCEIAGATATALPANFVNGTVLVRQ